jgi:transcription elongation factor GreA
MAARRSPDDAPAPRPATGALFASTSPADDVVLTPEGRRKLEARIRDLEATVAELLGTLDDAERSPETVEALQRSSHELDRLRVVVANAHSVDETQDDTRTVELGDSVRIRLETGDEESFIVVHSFEAAVDDRRISAESPLGRALLGRRVGETVDVLVPTGSYRCTILSAARLDESSPQ